MRATTTTSALLLCLALLAGAQAQQPRLVGYVPNSYARRCPSDVRVSVFAQAQTGGGRRGAFVSGTITVVSPMPGRVQSATITLFPTTALSPIVDDAQCNDVGTSCYFAVDVFASPTRTGPSSYAENWRGALATVTLTNRAVCESPIFYIMNAASWAALDRQVGGVAGDVGALIGSAVGRDAVVGSRGGLGGLLAGLPIVGRKMLLVATARA
jgi:hypothetical protein